MLFRFFLSLLFIIVLVSGTSSATDQPLVNLGRWSNSDLSQIIASAHKLETPGAQIVSLSGHFLDTAYVADILIGGPHRVEQLVINLSGFDCFTFLDVVEALRRASDIADFPDQLKQVRYRDGQVAYSRRRHFFSDWVTGDSAGIRDVTALVGEGSTRVVTRQLNLKKDGTNWLPEIAVSEREIRYLPTERIDQALLSGLKAGDYVGLYTDLPGLDVSHVGLIVKDKDRVILRHASSQRNLRRVVDVDLLEYLQGKPGLLVYRVR